VPVERYRDADATARLARVRPFLLRRRKIDPGSAPELPPKTESDLVVGLTAEHASLYQAVVDEVLAEIAATEGIQRREDGRRQLTDRVLLLPDDPLRVEAAEQSPGAISRNFRRDRVAHTNPSRSWVSTRTRQQPILSPTSADLALARFTSPLST